VTGTSPLPRPLGPQDDAPSPDEVGDDGGVALDLSPRRPAAGSGGTARGARGRARWPWLLVIGLLIVAIGFVITRALGDATQFYKTADEAVAQRAELEGRTFRLEGTVVEGSTTRTAEGVSFRVASSGTEVGVRHRGDPPPLFQACIPVVVEGRWDGDSFASTSLIVAHDEQYEEENSERMREAREAGAESNACAQRDAADLAARR
jgi:cytochrome c-type biogenesis protein CcmE